MYRLRCLCGFPAFLVGLLIASTVLAASPREGADLQLLTDRRLLELDQESGDLLAETLVEGGAGLAVAGDINAWLATADGALLPLGRAQGEGPPALQLPETALLMISSEDSGDLVVVTAERVEHFAGSARPEESHALPLVARALASDGRELWGWGDGGSFRLALDHPTGVLPFTAEAIRAGAPVAACWDPLAGLLAVGGERGVSWLGRGGREVAFTPLPGVAHLVCGRFGRVWAAGAFGIARLRSLGDVGAVEAAGELPGAAAPEALAADPATFDALVASSGRLLRLDADLDVQWSIWLEPGERVLGLAATCCSPAPGGGGSARLRRRSPPDPVVVPRTITAGSQGPISMGAPVEPDELVLTGRLLVEGTFDPFEDPPGGGVPVAGAEVNVFGSDLFRAISDPDGFFETAPFPYLGGSLRVQAKKDGVPGGLMTFPFGLGTTPGTIQDLEELFLEFGCPPAFTGGLFPAGALNGEVRSAVVFDDGTGPALYVGGTFTTAGGVTVNRVARWDGSAWSALGSGLTRTSGTPSVDALAVYDDGSGPELYAAGSFNRSGSSTVNYVARWTGSSWVQVGSGLNNQVLALAVYDDGSGSALYAGGTFTSAGGTTYNRLARWNGSSWQTVGGGANSTVRALAVYDDGSGPVLAVGGSFTQVGGSVSAARIASWDGTSWSALGSGVSGGTSIQVKALAAAVEDGLPVLYAGGRFTSAGGTSARYVARWDGTGWSALGDGLGAQVNALGLFDDGAGPALYAAGSFTSVFGESFNRLARWSGSYWEPIESGLDGNALALAAGDLGGGEALFVGGAFTTAGGADSSRLARVARPAACDDFDDPFVEFLQPPDGSSTSDSGHGPGTAQDDGGIRLRGLHRVGHRYARDRDSLRVRRDRTADQDHPPRRPGGGLRVRPQRKPDPDHAAVSTGPPVRAQRH